MSSKHKRKNSASLKTHWHNPSSSSLNSFHSAITNMELSQLTPPNSQELKATPHSASPEQEISSTDSPTQINPQPRPSPKLEAVKMGRQDSGFSDGVRSQNSSRPTSSSSSRPKIKRSSTGSRPSTRRAPRSGYTGTQHRSSISSSRPQMRSRHTVHDMQASPPHQFFQFPMLQEPAPSSELEPPPLPPPPPATVHYWTSDSTRRLEYAAIDAANHGLRGFFIRLVPDCILSEAARRTRFHDDDDDSDAGSVRRYRLVLPEEKDLAGDEDRGRAAQKQQRPSAFRRWTSLGFSKRKS